MKGKKVRKKRLGRRKKRETQKYAEREKIKRKTNIQPLR